MFDEKEQMMYYMKVAELHADLFSRYPSRGKFKFL